MKGILFKPDMIQAIIDGHKTQTRRLSGLAEVNKEPGRWGPPIRVERDVPPVKGGDWIFQDLTNMSHCIACKPRFHPWETLYIKEAWATEQQYDALPPRHIPRIARIHYMADGVGEWPTNLTIGKLRSPMFLMEWMARRFIKIGDKPGDVRPERLQSITQEDCIAEGIIAASLERPTIYSAPGIEGWYITPQLAYAALWDALNPALPWNFNPWLWRYVFSEDAEQSVGL